MLSDEETAEISAALEPITLTLGMLVSKDMRVGAKLLYDDENFNDVIRSYLLASYEFDSEKDRDLSRLLLSSGDFIAYLRGLFPEHSRGILTVAKRRYGNSLADLYRNSLSLKKLIEGRASAVDLEPVTLPSQQSSPIYTKIENERITLDAGQPAHPFLRRDSINQTREYLSKELTALSASLQESNVDRKYVESFSKLSGLIQFKDDAGAIAFGLHVRMIANLTSKIEDELSDVLGVQISSTLTHASYFASQYKDWIEFVQNAQAYPSREIIDLNIDKALADVEARLLNNAERVDQRIPQSLQLVRNVLSGSSEDRKQAIYAGVRGVENVCIAAINYCYEQAKRLVQDAGTKARPALVTLGAGAIIMITLTVISDFMPVIKNAAELNWILENLPKIEKIGKILTK